MKTTEALVLLALSLLHFSAARADSFGSGANTFDIEFVPIGNPDNPDDTTGVPNPAGKVEYDFRMAKYEISEEIIDKVNSLSGLGIVHDGRGSNKPATSITWFQSAQLVNWLNTSEGYSPAYKFNSSGFFELWEPTDPGYLPNNLYRNSLAHYFLTSYDEWYKAAYFEPTAGVYYDYPMGSDLVPDGIDFVGDTEFDAVFQDAGLEPLPHDVTDVGTNSPYGTYGQGGNVWEWLESDFDLINNSNVAPRNVRGGYWESPPSALSVTTQGVGIFPYNGATDVGLRVASIEPPVVPEPHSASLGALAAAGLLALRRRGTPD